jgi:hypothetical protein
MVISVHLVPAETYQILAFHDILFVMTDQSRLVHDHLGPLLRPRHAMSTKVIKCMCPWPKTLIRVFDSLGQCQVRWLTTLDITQHLFRLYHCTRHEDFAELE